MTFLPFRALRPTPQYAEHVASPPYDVLTSDEARIETRNNPLSFLHVTKPEIDLPSDIDPYEQSVYERGRKNLLDLTTKGVLRRDRNLCFYLYRLSTGDHSQTGIAGCVTVAEYLEGTVRRHELTMPEKERDRARHILATRAHTGPVLTTFRDTSRLAEMMDEVVGHQPELEFVASDGVRHQLWVVEEERMLRGIQHAFASMERMYIADGHHRSAAAAAAASAMRASAGREVRDAEFERFPVVAFPASQVRILPYNRIIRDLGGLRTEEFLESIRNVFAIERSPEPIAPRSKGEFGMYLDSVWYRIRAHTIRTSQTDPVAGLDVSILQENLLSPILGIGDPRTDKRIGFVGGVRGPAELERAVDTGEAAVAFSLCATSVEELLEVADRGLFMPPKSTWFEPKLRDGLVVHTFD